jgi:hypothetical protein
MKNKLDADDVRNMRALLEYRNKLRAELAELTNKKIGEKFDVNETTVFRVEHHKIYKGMA